MKIELKIIIENKKWKIMNESNKKNYKWIK